MSTGEASASSIAMGGKAGGGAGCAVSALRLTRLSYDSSAVRSKKGRKMPNICLPEPKMLSAGAA